MRDLIVTLIVFGSLPLILARPWTGAIMWAWIGYMNPHRLTWGFAYDFPFAMLVAVATLAGLVFTRDRRGIPLNHVTFWWFALILWMNLTTPFAISAENTLPEWERTMKIQLMALVTVVLIHRRQQLDWLIWTIVVSIGFFGIKGGIFAMLTGAEYSVRGPEDSFIEDNNALALALIMIMPLMRYLQLQTTRAWVKWGLTGAMGLSALAIFATHSRGALVAGSAMLLLLIVRSRHRGRLVLAAAALIPLIVSFMPEKWFTRMETISTYREDGSAMGRINAWWFAWNLAKDRPLVGGGFNTFDRKLFPKYAPNPKDFHDSHSNYFEMLAEHGFPGLVIYLALGVSVWMAAGGIVRRVRRLQAEARAGPSHWMEDLALMIQVSVVGYAVGGAFLGLAYYDLYYSVVGFVVILQRLLPELEGKETSQAAGARPAVALKARGAAGGAL
jgi:probable O-glycosylation ligase (exosortase A-associated)